MTQPISFAVQIAVVMIPAFVFIFAKPRIESIGWRMALGVLLAVIAGGVTFYLAAEHGFHPIAKSGRVVDLAPVTLSVINTALLLFVFSVFAFAKKERGKKESVQL